MTVLERVLYVDDDPDIRDIAKIALEKIGGLTVRVCGSGTEALGAVPQFQPDMVVLDVMMPGMDGPGTLKAIRALNETRRVPVVFITAKAMRTEVELYKTMGISEVIAKPFNPMQLADRLREVWDRYHNPPMD